MEGGYEMTSSSTESWTLRELQGELLRFEQELRAAGLRPSSIDTYVDRTERFLRWLAGDYTPQGPR